MSMPPPPPPGPPPPPPPEYGGTGGPGGHLAVGEILNRGWAAFTSRLVDFVIIAVAVGVINGVLSFAISGDEIRPARTFFVLIVTVLVSILGSLVTTRLALAAIDGDRRPLGELAGQAMGRAAPYLGWAILAGLIVLLGLLLCVLPGLAAAFFLCLVPFAAMEVRHGGSDPLSASFNAVKQEAGNIILVFLVFLGIGILIGLVSVALGVIPVIGAIIGAVIQFALSCFGLCSFGVIYRNTAMGRSAVRL